MRPQCLPAVGREFRTAGRLAREVFVRRLSTRLATEGRATTRGVGSVRSHSLERNATRLPENYRCGLPAVAEPTLNHFANGRGLADSPTLAIEPVLVCLPWPGVECPSWEAASHVR